MPQPIMVRPRRIIANNRCGISSATRCSAIAQSTDGRKDIVLSPGRGLIRLAARRFAPRLVSRFRLEFDRATNLCGKWREPTRFAAAKKEGASWLWRWSPERAAASASRHRFALARAGHTVVATMRNLERGAEIRKIAEEEKLPIHLVALDVDDDESRSARASPRSSPSTGRSIFWSTTPESPAAASSKRRLSTGFVR